MLFFPTLTTPYFKTGRLTKLAAAVESIYLKLIRGSSLDFIKARHFLYRYYIVKQDPASWDLLDRVGRIRTEEFAKRLIGHGGRENHYPRRLDYVYQRLRTGFYVHLFGIRPTPFSDTEVSLIAKSLFAADGYWRLHTYRAICIVFYLYFQQKVNLIAAAEEKFTRVFSGRQTSDIRNYVYGLTHFIICGTNFYQLPPPPKYQKYLAEIHRQKSNIPPEWIDLILETALAGKFYGQQIWSAAELEKIIQLRLVRDNGGTYIGGRLGGINRSEHVNALLILLVNDWQFLLRSI